MFTRLHRPGGAIGGLAVAAFLILAIYGVLGLASIPIAMATDSEVFSNQGDWSNGDDRVVGYVLFGLMVAGAIGFFIMDRHPGLGATLALLGCLALAIPFFWLVVPVLVGLVFAVVGFTRASWLSEHQPTAPTAPA